MARTTTERGLGYTHQRVREQLLARHHDGTPCWWCGQPMYRDPHRNFDHNPNIQLSGTLHADHSTARANHGTRADRLLHGQCNRERGDGSRDHLRPAITGKPITQATTDHTLLGHRAMPWP